jgi:hypothetical protein
VGEKRRKGEKEVRWLWGSVKVDILIFIIKPIYS